MDDVCHGNRAFTMRCHRALEEGLPAPVLAGQTPPEGEVALVEQRDAGPCAVECRNPFSRTGSGRTQALCGAEECRGRKPGLTLAEQPAVESDRHRGQLFCPGWGLDPVDWPGVGRA